MFGFARVLIRICCHVAELGGSLLPVGVLCGVLQSSFHGALFSYGECVVLICALPVPFNMHQYRTLSVQEVAPVQLPVDSIGACSAVRLWLCGGCLADMGLTALFRQPHERKPPFLAALAFLNRL